VLELVVEAEGAPPQREVLSDPSCVVLAEAVALKLAAAAEQTLDAKAVEIPMPEHGWSCEPRRLPAKRGDPKPCVAVRAWAAGQVGPLPGVGLGFGGGVALLWHRVRFEWEGHGWLPRQTSQPPPNAEFELFASTVSVCGRLGTAQIEVPLCGGVEVGAILGEGRDLAEPRSDRLVWAAGLVRGGIAWTPHPRVALFAQAALLANPLVLEFAVDENETIYRVPRIGGRFGGGVEVRLFVPRR